MRRRGLTLVEALIVLAVVAIVAGLLTPVFLKVKQNARVATSVGHVKQLLGALTLYRQDYDGVDVFEGERAYYRLGLPASKVGLWPWEQLGPYGATDEVWRPPCGFDESVYHDAPCWGEFNRICYASVFYDPVNRVPGSANNLLRDYLLRYRSNAVVFVDPFCNPPGTEVHLAHTWKRGIAGLLSGQVVSKQGRGSMGKIEGLFWFSEPER
jgi:prepilin-type N-terminal cleavage/methylation domain-containing protein